MSNTILWKRNIRCTFYRKDTGKGIDVTNNYVSFSITRTVESTPDSATIKIMNLNANHRQELAQKNMVLVLEVGYGDNPTYFRLYKGDILKARTEFQAGNWISNMECGDAATQILKKVHKKSYSGATDLKAIIKDAIREMGGIKTDPAALEAVLKDEKVDNGLTVLEPPMQTIKKAARKAGANAFIQDDKLYVLKTNQVVNEGAALLNSKTGLLDVPTQTDKGIEFKCLIQANVVPGRAVTIESKTVNGTYIISRVEMSGSNREQDWYIKGTGIQPQGVKIERV